MKKNPLKIRAKVGIMSFDIDLETNLPEKMKK